MSAVPRHRWGDAAVWLSGAVVVTDQASKMLVRWLMPLHTSVTIVPGMVDFTHVRNTGAAFGILNAADFPFKPVIILIVAAAALAGVVLYASQVSPQPRAARIGLFLIIGGAAGNLIDRLLVGYVIDFVDVYWRGYHFWAFNVADSAITVGVGIMMLDMLGIGRGRVSKAV